MTKETNKKLSCPQCHENDMLSTIESLEGLAQCDCIYEDGPDWNGTTDVLYETSQTVGVSCSCGWDYQGSDWLSHLSSE